MRFFRKLKEKIRWFIAYRLDRLSMYCWANLAMYGMGNYSLWYILRNPGGKGCKIESEFHGSERCYCGKFCNGVSQHASESSMLEEKLRKKRL